MASTQKHSKLKKINFYRAKAIVLALFPITLLLLPATFFDKGRDICLFTILSGYKCWGCGITRACMHMIHLDFKTAEQYNKLVFIVLPILCGLLLAEFLRTINIIRKYDKIKERLVQQQSEEVQ